MSDVDILYLAVFIAPPDDQVALGIPPAFPKPFKAVPPDKNKSPSLKIVDVGGGKDHSSVAAAGEPPAIIPDVLLVPPAET